MRKTSALPNYLTIQLPTLLMQLLRGDETQSRLRQIPGGVVTGRDLVEEVDLQILPIAAFDYFLFLAEVIEDVGWVGESLLPRFDSYHSNQPLPFPPRPQSDSK